MDKYEIHTNIGMTKGCPDLASFGLPAAGDIRGYQEAPTSRRHAEASHRGTAEARHHRIHTNENKGTPTLFDLSTHEQNPPSILTRDSVIDSFARWRVMEGWRDKRKNKVGVP